MTLVRQPKRSHVCGQAVVAMILGVSLNEACELLGHRRGTRSKELVRVLTRRGVVLGERQLTAYTPLPARAFLRLTKTKGKTRRHAMLLWDGVVYDPAALWPQQFPNWEITSFREIKGGDAVRTAVRD